MKKEDFKLDQQVIAKVTNGDKVTEKEGIIKGVKTDYQGNVKVQVEHLTPVISDFGLEDVNLK